MVGAARLLPFASAMRTLSIDIGGSHVKAAVVDARGRMCGDRERDDTPARLDRKRLLRAVLDLVDPLDGYDRVAVGVNGLVHGGVLYSLPASGNRDLRGFRLAAELERKLRVPVRLYNDATLHALGAIRRRGVEVTITLGTGLGAAVFIDGRQGPRLELLPCPDGDGTRGGHYGDAALEQLGRRKWSARVGRLVRALRVITNFDHLYIGGGNADELRLELPDDVSIVESSCAFTGGARAYELGIEE